MKRVFLVVLATVVLAACGKDSVAPDTNAYLKIQNNSGSTINGVYYSDCGNTVWGPERLGGSVISTSQSRTFTVTPGCFDIKVVNTGGYYVTFMGHNVAAGETYTGTVTN